MRHGRYTIIRKLAEGGMAEIFLAKQHGSVGFERPVVLKRIHSAFYADQQFRNMLVDEAHISMGLHHNNIVQTLDVGEARGRYFLVLELVDGWDLGRVLSRATDVRVAMPPALGLYVVAEMCRALAYAHGRVTAEGTPLSIVHRDVSPQNVLLSEQGEVKLADFGIAKAMTKRDQTASGVVKGKIAFMSPEQAQGLPIDARSDLFSLGSLLYLVTTGRRPFEAPTDLEVLLRVQKGEFIPADEVRPDLPPGLLTVLRRVMQADPDHRYQTAEELLVDLEGVLRAEYESAGQTELKLFLTELSRRDGVPAISLARPDQLGHTASDSGELMAGNAVELGDEAAPSDSMNEMDSMDEMASMDQAGERSARRVLEPSVTSGTRKRTLSAPRMTGQEATAMSDLSLAVAAASEDEPPGVRRRRGSGMRGIGIAVAIGGLVAAGGIIWQRMNPSPIVDPSASETDPPIPPAEGSQAAAVMPGQGTPAPVPEAPRPGVDRPTVVPVPAPPPSAAPIPTAVTGSPSTSQSRTAPVERPDPQPPTPSAWRRIESNAVDPAATVRRDAGTNVAPAAPAPAAAPAAAPTEPTAPVPQEAAPDPVLEVPAAPAPPPTDPPRADPPPAEEIRPLEPKPTADIPTSPPSP